MKKLHLDLTTLRVETFATHATASAGGTVQAHQETNGGSCFSDLCFPTDFCNTATCASMNATCAGTCGHEN